MRVLRVLLGKGGGDGTGKGRGERKREFTYGLRDGELLLLVSLELLPLMGLLGLRLVIRRGILRGLGESEYDDDLPRLACGARPLLGEGDRATLRTGERLRRRLIGDLLGGLLARLGGERRLIERGERLRIGLARALRGEILGGDLCRLGGDKGERTLPGDAGRLLGGVSPRR